MKQTWVNTRWDPLPLPNKGRSRERNRKHVLKIHDIGKHQDSLHPKQRKDKDRNKKHVIKMTMGKH